MTRQEKAKEELKSRCQLSTTETYRECCTRLRQVRLRRKPLRPRLEAEFEP